MILLNENSSRLAHDLILIDIIACILLMVSAVVAIPLLIIGYMGAPMGSKATKIPRVILACITGIIFLVSIALGLITVFADEYRYVGSANYTVEQVKTESSGKQMIVVNDGKSDVELDVKDNDKTSYTKADKVKIVVRSNKSDNAGKHYLSSIKRSDLSSPDVFSANYDIKKIDQ